MLRTVAALAAGCAAVALVGTAPGPQVRDSSHIQVWLEPDLVGAAQFASAVSTPGSPQFHRYLSPDAYTARFGPSTSQAKAVADWLTAAGMSDVRVSSERDYVSASGPASALAVPKSLEPGVLGVTGLGTSTAPAAQTTAARVPTCSRYWAEHVRAFSPAYRGLTKGSLPVCGYSARQLRAAYGATWAFAGKGQTIALTEGEAPTAMFQTLREYARRNHLPAPKASQFREIHLPGGSDCSTRIAAQYSDEAEMDSEAVYAMAPGASQLMVVGGGCDEDQALLNAALAVLTGDGHRPSASIVSNSWQIPIGDLPPETVHAITVRAVAEGVGMYFSSGDTPGLTTTASDPFVTAVGGTTLGLGAASNRVFETGWSNNTAMADEGQWSDADGQYQTQVNAGTSLAAPLVAGLVADAQQGRRSSFGFINPLIYRLHGTRAFHDILPVTAAMPQQNRAAVTPATATDSATVDVFDSKGPDTDQVTAKGYDTVTGVGTPNGLAFILGLRLTASHEPAAVRAEALCRPLPAMPS